MRVMMTTDTVGGVWTYTQELVRGLLSKGMDVTLVSLGSMPSGEQAQWAEAHAREAAGRFRFFPTEYPLEWMPEGARSFEESAPFLLDLLARERPDLFHSNQFCHGALPSRTPKLVVGHSDVISWWEARHSTAPPDDAWTRNYRGLVERGLAGADVVVTPSRWYLKQLQYKFGSLPGAQVIANGSSLPPVSKRERKLQAVTAGRLWDEGKNIALLRGLRPAMPILVAGSTVRPGEPESVVREDEDAVRFLGPLSRTALLQLLAESSVYIATSVYEPFGLAPLEAALAGCAVVANDIPSFREVWGETALYFRRNDAGALGEVLERLAADPAALWGAALAAQQRALALYRAETMTERYLALYRDLVVERASADVA